VPYKGDGDSVIEARRILESGCPTSDPSAAFILNELPDEARDRWKDIMLRSILQFSCGADS
jgi:hypothetical protein